MGESIMGRMNELGSRLEALEESISTVAHHAGLPVLEQSQPTSSTRIISTPTKSKQQQVVASQVGSPSRQMDASTPTKIAVEV